MAITLTPQQVAQKQARRTKAAVEDMRIGVQNVTEAPGVKAAAKAEKMLTNLTEAVQSGRWARNVKAVSLDQWKKDMLEKGVNRVAAGVDAAMPKTEAFFAELLPFQQGLQTEINKMPDLTLEDSVNRAATWIRGMGKFRKSSK